MNIGTEWVIDAEGCLPEALQDLLALRRVCERILTELELHRVGEAQWHKFSGAGGVTGLYLLTESHLACHTYPEVGTATFNLYCCRARSRWPWEERLIEMLGAAQVSVQRIERGTGGVTRLPLQVDQQQEVKEL